MNIYNDLFKVKNKFKNFDFLKDEHPNMYKVMTKALSRYRSDPYGFGNSWRSIVEGIINYFIYNKFDYSNDHENVFINIKSKLKDKLITEGNADFIARIIGVSYNNEFKNLDQYDFLNLKDTAIFHEKGKVYEHNNIIDLKDFASRHRNSVEIFNKYVQNYILSNCGQDVLSACSHRNDFDKDFLYKKAYPSYEQSITFVHFLLKSFLNNIPDIEKYELDFNFINIEEHIILNYTQNNDVTLFFTKKITQRDHSDADAESFFLIKQYENTYENQFSTFFYNSREQLTLLNKTLNRKEKYKFLSLYAFPPAIKCIDKKTNTEVCIDRFNFLEFELGHNCEDFMLITPCYKNEFNSKLLIESIGELIDTCHSVNQYLRDFDNESFVLIKENDDIIPHIINFDKVKLIRDSDYTIKFNNKSKSTFFFYSALDVVFIRSKKTNKILKNVDVYRFLILCIYILNGCIDLKNVNEGIELLKHNEILPLEKIRMIHEIFSKVVNIEDFELEISEVIELCT